MSANEAQALEYVSVLVDTGDFGLDEFTPEAVQLDDTGTAGNLIPGVEYLALTQEQLNAWRSEDVEITDDSDREGAFNIRFKGLGTIATSKNTTVTNKGE